MSESGGSRDLRGERERAAEKQVNNHSDFKSHNHFRRNLFLPLCVIMSTSPFSIATHPAQRVAEMLESIPPINT